MVSVQEPAEHDRIVELPDEPQLLAGEPRSNALNEPPSNPRGAWLLPLVALAAIVAGALFVMRGPDKAFAIAFGALVVIGLSWVCISALFPNRPDRRCPECGATALVRLSRTSTTGIRCRRCSWVDETASSFFLAEEDGPLEDIVLRKRQERREKQESR